MAIAVTEIRESSKRLFTKSAAKAKAATQPVRPERIGSELREQMIAELAYYRAEKRGFEPGHELEDWLAAEQEIDALAQAAA